MAESSVKYATYKPTEICAKCKGGCCRFYGCHFSPTDFKEISFESLKTEIEKGRISITGGKLNQRNTSSAAGTSVNL